MKTGAYLLILKVKAQNLVIGALGELDFKSGYYVYVGSAMNGLKARLDRHRSKHKRMHWHIDYLLDKAELVEILSFPDKLKRECEFSRKVSETADSEVKDFGCSDCSCNSHLYYFRSFPKHLHSLS